VAFSGKAALQVLTKINSFKYKEEDKTMHIDLIIQIIIVSVVLYIILKNTILNFVKEEAPINVISYLYTPGYVLIDVRERDEFFKGHIPKSINLPLSNLKYLFKEIPTDKKIIFVCTNGKKCKKVISFLKDKGFDKISNLKGGLVAWKKLGYQLDYGT
jgi:rhodanese-related sulfurtransferase